MLQKCKCERNNFSPHSDTRPFEQMIESTLVYWVLHHSKII